MPNLPTIENEEPILAAQQINSTAKSSDDFAKYLGSISSNAVKMAEAEYEFQSKSHAVFSQNQMAENVGKSYVQMAQHPDQALSIAKNAQEANEEIKQNAFVNRNDRLALTQISDNYNLRTTLQASKTAFQQSLFDTRQMITNTVPSLIQSINQDYMNGDSEAAHKKQDLAIQLANDGLKKHSITPAMHQKIIKLINEPTEHAMAVFDALKNGKTSARDVQELNQTPLGPINTDLAGTPTDHYVSEHHTDLNSDTAEHLVENQIAENGYISGRELLWPIKKDSTIAKLGRMAGGAGKTNAMLNSNTPYPVMQHRFDMLENKSKVESLNFEEQGELKRGKFLNNLLDRDYPAYIAQTPLGQTIDQTSRMNELSIQNSPNLSPEQKTALLKANKDWTLTEKINVGHSMHIPPYKIKPLNNEEMLPFVTGFMPQQNPSILTTNLLATSPILRPYIAASMPDATRAGTTFLAYQGIEKYSQGFANDLIEANQYELKDEKKLSEGFGRVDKDSIAKGSITAKIASDTTLKPVFDHLRDLPEGGKLVDGVLQSLTNYGYKKAKDNGDLGLSHFDSVLETLREEVPKAFDIYSDPNARINNSTLSRPLTPYEAEAMGVYAVEKSYEKIKDQMSHLEFLDLIDRHPLMLVNMPNNVFAVIDSNTKRLAVDKNNQPLYQYPFSNSELSAALVHMKGRELFGLNKDQNINVMGIPSGFAGYQDSPESNSSFSFSLINSAHAAGNNQNNNINQLEEFNQKYGSFLTKYKSEAKMPKELEITEDGIKFIFKAEGLRLKGYMPNRNDRPTIGYGHTDGVKLSDVITKEQAIKFGHKDAAKAVNAVKKGVKVPLTQNQLHALGSFTYNEGPNAFLNSTLLKVINKKEWEKVPHEFRQWNKQRSKKTGKLEVNKGLANRREAEIKLFFS